MNWLEELKKRVDIWEPATSDGTSSITMEHYCLENVETAEIPKIEFDRLIAIAEKAETTSDHDNWLFYCTICRYLKTNKEDEQKHTPDCPYSDEWDGS